MLVLGIWTFVSPNLICGAYIPYFAWTASLVLTVCSLFMANSSFFMFLGNFKCVVENGVSSYLLLSLLGFTYLSPYLWWFTSFLSWTMSLILILSLDCFCSPFMINSARFMFLVSTYLKVLGIGAVFRIYWDLVICILTYVVIFVALISFLIYVFGLNYCLD